ncbi:MAG TPA: hypothetical protein VGK73_06520 [Polyangiaceae bacterium]
MTRQLGTALTLLFLSNTALAQQPAPTTPPAPAAPAPSPAAPSPPPAAAVPPTPPPAAQCFPACREGFLCHGGACISECNPACPPGQACRAGGRCEIEAVPPAAVAPGPAGPPADPGWARGAAYFSYISGAIILGGTAGVMAMNDSSTDDDARMAGIATTVYLAASAPIVAVGGGSARHHPDVKGATALRVVSWVGYALALVDAGFLVGVSFENEVSNAHIFSVGLLGALSTVGLGVDAHISAAQAEAVRDSQTPPPAQPGFTLAPVLGMASAGSERRVPYAGVRGEF